MKADLKWPAVVVILGLLLVLGGLSWAGKDATMVLAGVIAVLGALGFAHVSNKQTDIQATADTIKEQTNGRMGQLTELLEQMRRDQMNGNDQHRRDMKEMADKLALMIPPTTISPTSGAPAYVAEEDHSPNV